MAAIALLALTVWAIVQGTTSHDRPIPESAEQSDLGLYEQIVKRVDRGEPYYHAAIAEQSDRGYPTSPPTTVRLPSLALLIAGVGETGARLVLVALLATGLIASIRTAEKIARSRLEWWAFALTLAVSVALSAAPDAIYFHEVWAMTLILIALNIRTTRWWWIAVILGVLAFTVRELAGPFILAMFVLSSFERQWIRATTWLVAGAVCLMTYRFSHFEVVSSFMDGTETPSPSWIQMGGWPFIVDLVKSTTPLSVIPFAGAAIVVAISIFGWIGTRDRVSKGYLATLFAFIAVFSVVGRPDNVYWGLLFAPFLLPGLAFAPRSALTATRSGVLQGTRRSSPRK